MIMTTDGAKQITSSLLFIEVAGPTVLLDAVNCLWGSPKSDRLKIMQDYLVLIKLHDHRLFQRQG
jgi:hypothetical protein